MSPSRPAARTRSSRRLVVGAGALAAATLLGGCSFWSPDVTLEPYSASDGINADLGDVLVRNVLVVSDGEGEPGVVAGALVSRSDEATDVLLEVGGSSIVVELDAGESVLLGTPDGEQVVVDSVDGAPGSYVDLRVTNEATGAVTLQVPVQLPEGPYEGITPPPAAGQPGEDSTDPDAGVVEPTGEPTGEATGEATGEPTDEALEPSEEPSPATS